MLSAVRTLVDRVLYPRSRADELLSLRRRFRAARKLAQACSAEELAIAKTMREQRTRIAAATRQPRTCTLCAKKYPPPHGQWDGGYCCGTDTWRVFTDDELVAIAAAGTSVDELQAPRCEHAGCVFRGPTGCSIPPAERPNICLRYLCLPLVAELRAQGELKSIDAMCKELETDFRRFTELRSAREQREHFEELERSIAATPTSHPPKPALGWKQWIFVMLAAGFGVAASLHAAALVVPTILEPSPWWRHLLFVAINGAVAVLLVRRPAWFAFVFALLALQQLISHGLSGWSVWILERRIDWASVVVVVAVPAIAALLLGEAWTRASRTRRASASNR